MAAQVHRIAARIFPVFWLAAIALGFTDRADRSLGLSDFVVLATGLAIAATSCSIAYRARKDGTQAVIKGLAAATRPPDEASRPDLHVAR